MAASPKLKVGDTAYNLESARECFDEAERVGANLLVFPELHLTAYTCGDLFYYDTLLDGALEALEALRDYTSGKRCMAVIGVPVRTGGKLYNCAAVIQNGKLMGIVPKMFLPNNREFYESRWFAAGLRIADNVSSVQLFGEEIPFGHLIFTDNTRSLSFGVEFYAGLSSLHALPARLRRRPDGRGARLLPNA